MLDQWITAHRNISIILKSEKKIQGQVEKNIALANEFITRVGKEYLDQFPHAKVKFLDRIGQIVYLFKEEDEKEVLEIFQEYKTPIFHPISMKPPPLGGGISLRNLGGVRNPSQINPRPLGRGSCRWQATRCVSRR